MCFGVWQMKKMNEVSKLDAYFRAHDNRTNEKWKLTQTKEEEDDRDAYSSAMEAMVNFMFVEC